MLSLTLLVPFVGAIILALIPSRNDNAIRYVAVTAATIAFLLSLYVFVAYDYTVGGFQFEEQYRWLPQLGISVHLAVDGIAVPMVFLTGIVIFTGAFVSWKISYRNKDFFILLLVLVSGVYGVFESIDTFFLFFCYELAVIPMFLLISVWGSSSDFGTFRRTKEYGAMKLVVYLTAGSVLVWLAIIAIFVATGMKSFDLFYLEQQEFTRSFQLFFFPFLMFGFGTLAGMWPLHTWSPDGHVAAPTAVSMLHAGVLMKLGAFGIIRMGITLMPEAAQFWAPLMVALATVNAVYGATSAMGQIDLKYVIGYSSVSHMGLVIIGFAALTPVALSGAVFQMFAHGIMTALFFALVGVIYDGAHTRIISGFGGLAEKMPKTAICFSVGGLSSLGLPGLAGFIAEFMIFVGTFPVYPVVAVLGIVGAAITAVYILRLIGTAFYGPLNPRWAHLPDANRSETFGIAVLVFFLVLGGIVPQLFIRIISTGIAPIVAKLAGV